MNPPVVTIHGWTDAQLALSMQAPLTLLSGPNAGSYAGAPWWREVIARAAAAFGPVPDILDCGDNPAVAIEALRAGCRTLVLVSGPAWHDVAARAAGLGCVVLPVRPPSFDLAGFRPRDARWHLAAWLRSATPATNGDGDGT